MDTCLVVWNMAFMFPYIGNVIIPTDELIFFRGVGQPPTRNDILSGWIAIEHSYWKWPCIVIFSHKNVIFHSYVSLPEGTITLPQGPRRWTCWSPSWIAAATPSVTRRRKRCFFWMWKNGGYRMPPPQWCLLVYNHIWRYLYVSYTIVLILINQLS